MFKIILYSHEPSCYFQRQFFQLLLKDGTVSVPYLPPIFKEVLPKNLFGGVLVVQHLGEEQRHLLCRQAKLHLLTCMSKARGKTMFLFQ